MGYPIVVGRGRIVLVLIDREQKQPGCAPLFGAGSAFITSGCQFATGDELAGRKALPKAVVHYSQAFALAFAVFKRLQS